MRYNRIMNNFKYSLKTQQFGKKRYQIFPRENEKQSMSLEVIEPHHNVSHLLELNKSEQQSAIMYSKQNLTEGENEEKQLEQQVQTVKLPPQLPHNNIHQLQRQKNICHSIQATEKIQIPSLARDVDQRLSSADERQQLKQSLRIIQYTVLSNEERLNKLVDSINNLYRNTIDLYNSHERKLKQAVNQRCYDIIRIFRFTLAQIDRKQQIIDQLDKNIMVLLNTLKENKESLRITKIKQECIEALQREHQKNMEKDRKQKRNPISYQRESQSINESTHATEYVQPISYSIEFSVKNEGQGKRAPKQFSMITCNEDPHELVQSFISSPATVNQLQQKSPFEANQLYQISSTVPVMNIGEPTSIHHKQAEYSFRKAIPVYMTHQNNRNNSRRQSGKEKLYSSKNMSTNILKLQQTLSQLKQGDLCREIWVDNLNCLRRKNGTYVLDQSGNPIICTHDELQLLLRM